MSFAAQDSPSASRVSLTSRISAFGAKLGLGQKVGHDNDEDEDVVSPILLRSERSTSRGREIYQSTGRGGAGNMRPASKSRDPESRSGPDDFSQTRGREPIQQEHQPIFSTGRGGAGNMRSPSRDAANRPAVDNNEKNVIREYQAAHEGAPVSTGRGGIGNISRSRSRDPQGRSSSNVPPHHSTGRGGVGNILHGVGHNQEAEDEEERRKFSSSHEHHDGLHSSGRGGAANITSTHEPAVEHHHHPHAAYESTGRGGAGNIIHES